MTERNHSFLVRQATSLVVAFGLALFLFVGSVSYTLAEDAVVVEETPTTSETVEAVQDIPEIASEDNQNAEETPVTETDNETGPSAGAEDQAPEIASTTEETEKIEETSVAKDQAQEFSAMAASAAGTILVTDPDSGVVLTRGSSQTFVWSTTNVESSAKINLALRKVETGDMYQVMSNEENSGSFVWNSVGTTKTGETIADGDYRVVICVSGSDGQVCDNDTVVTIETTVAPDNRDWFVQYYDYDVSHPDMDLPGEEWNKPYGDPLSDQAAWEGDWYENQYLVSNGSRYIEDLSFGEDFFPLDYLGNDPTNTNHNYHFGAHFNTKATVDSDGSYGFSLTSDDDVWVYVNGELVSSLPGVHAPRQTTGSVDMEADKSYVIDVFYAERHVERAHLDFAFDSSEVELNPCDGFCEIDDGGEEDNRSIELITPADGSTLVRGSAQGYTWQSENVSPDRPIHIYFRKIGSSTTHIITNEEPNDGSVSANSVPRVGTTKSGYVLPDGEYIVAICVTNSGGKVCDTDNLVNLVSEDDEEKDWYGQLYNYDASHPAMNLPKAQWGNTYGDPLSVKANWEGDWYENQYLVPNSSRYEGDLLFGGGWYPLDYLGNDPAGFDHNFHFGAHFNTKATVDEAGTYSMRLKSDDDAWVYINGKLVIDLAGLHVPTEKTGQFYMVPGQSYVIDVYYADRREDYTFLDFEFTTDGVELTPCEGFCPIVEDNRSLKLTSPANGSVLIRGEKTGYTWTSENIPSTATINIFYRLVGSTTKYQIAGGPEYNDGVLTAQEAPVIGLTKQGEVIPNGDYRVVICLSGSEGQVCDNRTIVTVSGTDPNDNRRLNLTWPTNGSVLIRGTEQGYAWTSENIPSTATINIFYRLVGSTTKYQIAGGPEYNDGLLASSTAPRVGLTKQGETIPNGDYRVVICLSGSEGQVCDNRTIVTVKNSGGGGGGDDDDTSGPSTPIIVSPVPPTVSSSTSIVVPVTWTDSTDPIVSGRDTSGLAGYSFVWDHSSTTIPDNSVDGQATTTSQTLTEGVWWFHVKAIDNAGNTSATTHHGPFCIGNVVCPVEDTFRIINIRVTDITPTSAVIRWTTVNPDGSFHLSNSRVIYDTVSHPNISGFSAPNFGYANSTATFDETNKVYEHAVSVTGLTPSTRYYFRVLSQGSPLVISDEFSGTVSTTSDDGSEGSFVTPGNGGGNGGGGGGGGSRRRTTQTVATTTLPASCTPYLQKFIKLGADNDKAEVLKLQAFLKVYEGYSEVPLTGIYDQVTYEAVRKFQTRYMDVLTAWGIDEPTGYVFISTQMKINLIYCGIMDPLTISLRYPDQGVGARYAQAGAKPTIDLTQITSADATTTTESDIAYTLGATSTATTSNVFQLAALGLLSFLSDYTWIWLPILILVVLWLFWAFGRKKSKTTDSGTPMNKNK